MTDIATYEAPPRPVPRAAQVEIIVPVRNEQTDLGPSVRRLRAYLDDSFPFTTQLCIADNASTDETWALALDLVDELDGVRAVRLSESGRGRALKAVWSCSDAEVVAYMDVDLSTDLDALLPLIAPLLSGHSDIAIGTRLARGSRVVRGAKREILSVGYNGLLRTVMGARFTDAQCGFKALRADVAASLLPLVEDTGWFFDTELLVLAERAGMRIHEVPVDWVDDLDSRVAVASTVIADLRGIGRLTRRFATGRLDVEPIRLRFGRERLAAPPVFVRLLSFAFVGVLSTIAYVVLYLAARDVVGAQLANLTALLLTAVANTALNRRLTFGVLGRRDVVRHHLKGLLAFAVGWGLTASALWVGAAMSAHPSRTTEVLMLTAANLLSTTARFGLFEHWVFARTADRQMEEA